MAETFKIIVDQTVRGTADVKRASEAYDELEQASGRASFSFAELNQGLELVSTGLEYAFTAATALYDVLGEGAEIEATKGKFDALAGSIDTTSESLLSGMREATRGTITDFELMQSANELLGLGLTSTQGETERLSALIGQLGWDMQTLTLTLANQSTARLDSLGLSMTEVTGKAAELRNAGMAADEAFKLAVIEAGEAKLQLLGDSADTTAGKMQRLEAFFGNVEDAGKSAVALGLSPMVDMLDELASRIGGFDSATSLLADGIEQAFAPLVTGVTDALAVWDALEGTGDTQITSWRDLGAAVRELFTEDLPEALNSVSTLDERTVEFTDNMGAGFAAAAEPVMTLTSVLVGLDEAAAGVFANSLGDDGALWVETFERAHLSVANYEDAVLSAALATAENANQALIAAAILGDWSEAQLEAAFKAAALEEAIRLQLDAWDGTAEGLVTAKANLDSFVDELQAMDLSEEIGELQALSGAIQQVVGEHTVDIIVNQQGGFAGIDEGGQSQSGQGGQDLEGFRAGGGPVLGGGAYMVGESGPELFVPQSAGNIVDSSTVSTMGGGQTVNIYVSGAEATALILDSFEMDSESLTVLD